MEKDLSIQELVDLLVKKIHIPYGRIEIKIHESDWTNFEVTERINKNEVKAKEFIKQKLTKKDTRNVS